MKRKKEAQFNKIMKKLSKGHSFLFTFEKTMLLSVATEGETMDKKPENLTSNPVIWVAYFAIKEARNGS